MVLQIGARKPKFFPVWIPLESSHVHQVVIVTYDTTSTTTRENFQPVIEIRGTPAIQVSVKGNSLLAINGENSIDQRSLKARLLS